MSNDSKIAVTWIELVLVLLLTAVGLGIWTGAAKLAEASLSEKVPKEDEIQRRHGVAAARRRRAETEEDRNATLTLRIEQHLEVERRSAQIAALERTFPDLRSAKPGEGPTPLTIQDAYREALQQKLAAALLKQRLARRLRALELRLDRAEGAARQATQAAARDLESVRARFAWARRSRTAGFRGAGLAVFLLAAYALLSSPTAHRARIHRGPVLAATALLLFILCLYELLGTAFAAAFGGLLLLAGLWMLLRSVSARAADGR